MSKALYRKYRSKRLDDIVGQSHVTEILAQSLKQGHISHAYLLTGPRGIGKTSIARILAHELNGLEYNEDTTHLDIIEIDAASNNGVEDVRDLREKVQITPVSAPRKVYIIDEVHMLSKAAFNALLKTLEEPPAHAVFILATTDADKLPSTIISRTQRFNLRAISTKDAVVHLRHIATQENIPIEDDALELIALRGEGSFRDSIGILDQLRGLSAGADKISRQTVEKFLGMAPHDLVAKLLAAYEQNNLAETVRLLDQSEAEGVQPTLLTSQLVREIRVTIAKKPHFLPLLSQLLEVPKSSLPAVKLLTVLGMQGFTPKVQQPPAPKPRAAALAAPVPVVSAPVSELKKPAPKPKSKDAQPSKEATAPEELSGHIAPTGDFDWGKLVEFTRQNHVAVFSVLSKCGYAYENDTLTLYTGNAFYKKKLDDSKYRITLSQALRETGAGDLAIETIPTAPPPKDSTAAAVAALMGGGEEVTVDEQAAV